jgi:hypothetical protein
MFSGAGVSSFGASSTEFYFWPRSIFILEKGKLRIYLKPWARVFFLLPKIPLRLDDFSLTDSDLLLFLVNIPPSGYLSMAIS